MVNNAIVPYDPEAAQRRQSIVQQVATVAANLPPETRDALGRAIINGIASGEAERAIRTVWQIIPSRQTALELIQGIQNLPARTGLTWEQMQQLLPQNNDELISAAYAAIQGGVAGAAFGGPVGAVAGATGAFLGAPTTERNINIAMGGRPQRPQRTVAIEADGTMNDMIDAANEDANSLWGGRTRASAPGHQHGDESLPDLSDLIPENTGQGTSQMEDQSPNPAASAENFVNFLQAGTSGNNNVSKETPISNYPTLNYGLQETHTTILPYKTWFSVYRADTGTPIQVGIRMNSIVDMMSGLSMGNATTTLAKGFYNRPFKHDGTISHANADGTANTAEFPAYIANGTDSVAEKPSWREFWFKMYEYYTVLKCHYKITVYNANAQQGASIIIGTQFDSYSDAAGSTGNRMPTAATLVQAMQFKNIKWEVVEYARSEHPNKHVTVIEGTYYPGSIHRNIRNDGDVKTWTPTTNTGTPSSSIPTLKDLLTLNFWRAPMAWEINTACNVEVELKYVVQFKDLKEQWRYPYSGSTATSLTTGTDIVMGQ